MLGVFLLSVTYAEGRYSECRYADCRGAVNSTFLYFEKI
jgi:hypothetical protein